MIKTPTLVVVDDDESLLDIVSKSLAGSGYSGKMFASAETALAWLEKNDADILVTDIMMPGMKGLELTRRVKHLRPNMSVIVMTGFVGDFSYDQAIEAGAADFIKKPFSIDELLVRIKHVMVQEKLREMSITDELTGLPNRRGFFAVAQQQLNIVHRMKGKMALLFADLDAFKAINDTWGHMQGDLALVAIADIFKQTFRESDLIARMGGDEFAILLIDTPETNISIIQDRLQKKLDRYNKRAECAFTLSVSIGMAVFDHDHPCLLDELIKQADERMYRQKQLKKDACQLPQS